MVRARLAALALAAGLLFTSGCGFCRGWFQRHRSLSECECLDPCGGLPGYDVTGFEGPLVVPPGDLGAVPPLMVPPTLTPPPPALGPQPRVVPVPQAYPMPYSPTKFFRR